MKKHYLACVLVCLNLISTMSFAEDKLVVISPHRKSIEQELVPVFKKYYADTYKTTINVEWLDQGGASDDLRYILTRFEKDPVSSGIDVLWGGGEHPHLELDRLKLLQAYNISSSLKSEIPENIHGVLLYNKAETWHASALSSFGIFYNKIMLQRLKMKAPESWSDLGQSLYFGNISNSDPRGSSSFVTMNCVILQALGWEKGWDLLTRIAGNTRKYTNSSTAPIKSVVTGDAVASLAIAYYANSKIGDLGAKNLGFTYPKDKTIINSDPISILKGAPNRLAANRFIDFILSSQAQKLLILPKGVKDGPKFSSLGRMAINRRAYQETKGATLEDLNPFDLKLPLFMLDIERVAKVQFVIADLIGAIHIDTHKELRNAWEVLIQNGLPDAGLKLLTEVPVVQKDLDVYAKKWTDHAFRNQIVNSWVGYAQKKYAKIIADYSKDKLKPSQKR